MMNSEYLKAFNSMGESGIYWIDMVFNICVIALVDLARFLGISYEEINVWIFVIIWPSLTVYLFLRNLFLKKKLKKLMSKPYLLLSKE